MIAIWLGAAALAGYMIGSIRSDSYWEKVCRSQQERGDHWFDKYIAEAKRRDEPYDY